MPALLSLTFGAVACIPLLGVIPVVLGIIGLKRSREMGGRGMATAGLVLGICGMAWSAVLGLYIIPSSVRQWKESAAGRESAQRFMVELGTGKLDDAMMRGGETLDRRTLDEIYVRVQPLGTFEHVRFTNSKSTRDDSGNEVFDGAGLLKFELAETSFDIRLLSRGGLRYVDRVNVGDPLLVRKPPTTNPAPPKP